MLATAASVCKRQRPDSRHQGDKTCIFLFSPALAEGGATRGLAALPASRAQGRWLFIFVCRGRPALAPRVSERPFSWVKSLRDGAPRRVPRRRPAPPCES